MTDKDYFDLMSLPPELRTMIYEFAFAARSETHVDLLRHSGPACSLLPVSQCVRSESFKLFDRAMNEHRCQQKQLVRDIASYLEMAQGDAGWNLPTTSHVLAKVAHQIRTDGGIQCMHKCGRLCSGRTCHHQIKLWTACHCCRTMHLFAAYYHLHPEEMPRLISDDGSSELTDLGKDVTRWCEKPWRS